MRHILAKAQDRDLILDTRVSQDPPPIAIRPTILFAHVEAIGIIGPFAR